MIYIRALLLTIAAEYLILLLFYRAKLLVSFLYIFLINLFTNPLANLFYERLLLHFPGSGYGIEPIPFLIVESLVVIVEWILIKTLFGFSYSKSFLISLICNTVTASLSFIT